MESTADRDREVRTAVRTSYDDLAPHYEQRWERYVRRSVQETMRRLAVRGNERLLVVGCGTGAFLAAAERAWPQLRLSGVDLSAGMLQHARRRLSSAVTLAVADVQRLLFRDASYDVAVSLSSFHFWPDPVAGLTEIHRVLRPGAHVIITDWCDDFVACRLCDLYLKWRDPAHLRMFGRDACRDMLTAAGFHTRFIDRYKISWLWGLMTAVAEKR